MKKLATMALLASTFVFAQAPATSQQGRPAQKFRHGGQMRGQMHEQMTANLNLTAAQKEKAKTLFDQSRANSAGVREQMSKNREALSAAMKANNPAEIQKLSREQGELRGQLLTMRADTRAKFVALLTPEQRTKFEANKERMKERMKERWQERSRSIEPEE